MISNRVAVRIAVALASAIAVRAPLPAIAHTLVRGDDYRLLVTLATPAISPDGRLAALVVSRTVWDDDRTADDLVVVDLRTRAQRTIVADGKDLSSPAFSPDGTRLAYVADRGTGEEAHAQIFVAPIDAVQTQTPAATEPPAGQSQAVTDVETGVRGFSWRPDGQAFVYAATDAAPKRTGADRYRDSFVFTTEPIVAHEAPQPVHLFLQNVAGGDPAQLTFGSESVVDGSSLSWSPDGDAIAFTLARNAILNDQSYSRVAIVDVASKRVRPLTGRTMWEGNPLFSPDGKHVAYLYSNGDEQVNLTQLYVTTPAGGPGIAVSAPLDRNIADAVWSGDSRSLIATGPDRTTNAFFRIPLRGTPQRLSVDSLVPGIPLETTGGADVPGLDTAVARDGSIAFVGTGTAQPPELFVRTPAGDVDRVTDFNAELSARTWARAERLTFPTTTGVTGDGVLYLPPDFSPAKRYPLVVYIHGGPGDGSMMEFDFWAQVMAARGWLVLRPNYRGSPNLGLR